MKTIIKIILTVVMSSSVFAVPVAKTDSKKRGREVKIRYKNPKEMDFEELLIQGKLRRPNLSVITGSTENNDSNLLRLRKNFLGQGVNRFWRRSEMINISSANGRLLRIIPCPKKDLPFGYHQRFGVVSKETALAREYNRKRFGLMGEHSNAEAWLCQFHLAPKGQGKFEVINGEDCHISYKEDIWWIKTPMLSLQLSSSGASNFISTSFDVDHTPSSKKEVLWASLILMALMTTVLMTPWREKKVVKEKKEETPVLVKIVRPKRTVTVSRPRAFKGVQSFAKNRKQENKVRRLVSQNLGFLGVLGEEKLRKALGGTPSKLKDVSPGAGPGGTEEGSGGELLVGLGKGIRKVTVGNTGTVGLGGVGTKGRGGGQGGYGNATVSYAGTGGLGNIALSEEVIIDGGLSQAVIQATIEKNLPQVRACYEAGLQKWPGLAGTVATKFEIGPTGQLNYSKISRSTLDNSQVENCIIRSMKKWQFPGPEGGVRVKVNYPFLLRPVQL